MKMNEWISFEDWLKDKEFHDALQEHFEEYLKNKDKYEDRLPIRIYKCMVCEVQYVEGYLPTIGNADGCCTVGSLIEVKEI